MCIDDKSRSNSLVYDIVRLNEVTATWVHLIGMFVLPVAMYNEWSLGK